MLQLCACIECVLWLMTGSISHRADKLKLRCSAWMPTPAAQHSPVPLSARFRTHVALDIPSLSCHMSLMRPRNQNLSACMLALPGLCLLPVQVAERAEARYYVDPAAMQDDVRQVFRNCELYNPPGSDIRFLAQGLEVRPTLAAPDRVWRPSLRGYNPP